jgi:hypothetical protein
MSEINNETDVDDTDVVDMSSNEYGHYYYNSETEQTGIVFGCHVANGFFESHPECEDLGPVVVERVLEIG